MTLALAADFLLGKTPGSMAVNLSTTGLIEKVAAGHDCRVFRTPVGEANVVETILAEDCVLGGEGNGGVIYPTIHAGRDALVGILMVLQALAESGKTLSEMADALPPVVMVKTKVAAEDLPAGQELQDVLRGLGRGRDRHPGWPQVGGREFLGARATLQHRARGAHHCRGSRPGRGCRTDRQDQVGRVTRSGSMCLLWSAAPRRVPLVAHTPGGIDPCAESSE